MTRWPAAATTNGRPASFAAWKNASPRCRSMRRSLRESATTMRLSLLRVASEPSANDARSEEHTSELQSLMRLSYAVFCLKKKTTKHIKQHHDNNTVTN